MTQTERSSSEGSAVLRAEGRGERCSGHPRRFSAMLGLRVGNSPAHVVRSDE